VDEERFDARNNAAGAVQGDLFQSARAAGYRQLLTEKNRLIRDYRGASELAKDHLDLQVLRKNIEAHKAQAYATLNEILLNEFQRLKIQYEQAQPNGKPKKRPLNLEDITELQPFHWGYEFDEVIETRGGFDVIITNPPWEIFKPQAKEFFADYSDVVTKNKMDIKMFEKEQAKLLEDPEIKAAWLEYLSRFPYVNAYFRSATQYENQASVTEGKRTSIDLNLYKLFTEQCFNLLRFGGLCGIVIPSSLYTDLGSKQLREMLFNQNHITGLFAFENRKEIFEGVHRSFKFVVLTFEKGNHTNQFPVAFMRHDVQELENFPGEGSLRLSVDLIRSLSPDSLSIMEFNNELDIQIAKQMLKFPLLAGCRRDKKSYE